MGFHCDDAVDAATLCLSSTRKIVDMDGPVTPQQAWVKMRMRSQKYKFKVRDILVAMHALKLVATIERY